MSYKGTLYTLYTIETFYSDKYAEQCSDNPSAFASR